MLLMTRYDWKKEREMLQLGAYRIVRAGRRPAIRDAIIS